MIPKSGGDYAYISEAFGELPGFLYLWSALIMIMPAGNAIISLTFANNVLQPFFADCEPPDNAVRLLAATIICKSNFSKIIPCKGKMIFISFYTYRFAMCTFINSSFQVCSLQSIATMSNPPHLFKTYLRRQRFLHC